MYCNNCGLQCSKEDGSLVDSMFYSPEGRTEYWISGLCEYCFDDCTRDEDDDSYPTDDEEDAF